MTDLLNRVIATRTNNDLGNQNEQINGEHRGQENVSQGVDQNGDNVVNPKSNEPVEGNNRTAKPKKSTTADDSSGDKLNIH